MGAHDSDATRGRADRSFGTRRAGGDCVVPVIVAPPLDLLAILPIVIVSITAMVVLIIGLFIPREQGGVLGAIGLIGVGFAIVGAVALWGQTRAAFNGTIVADGFSIFFGVVALAIV